MKEILEKLSEVFDNHPTVKDDNETGNDIGDYISWKELYKLYAFAKDYYDALIRISDGVKLKDYTDINELKVEPVITCTIIGDCGKVHQSIKEWHECKVCETIMQRNTNPLTGKD